MPRVKGATMKLVVSFNCAIDGIEYGDVESWTEDFEGDDIDELAEEVIAGDPNYPLYFVRNADYDHIAEPVAGYFKGKDEHEFVAIMMDTSYFQS